MPFVQKLLLGSSQWKAPAAIEAKEDEVKDEPKSPGSNHVTASDMEES